MAGRHPKYKQLTDAEITAYQDIVTAAIPPECWREIEDHRHHDRLDRALERVHPFTDFVLPNSGEARAGTRAFLHALDELVRHHYRDNPDEAFSFTFTSVNHPELIAAGFTDQAEIRLQLSHADVFKQIKSDVLERQMNTLFRQIYDALGTEGIDDLIRLATDGGPDTSHFRSNVEAARYSLGLYLGDSPIPLSEVTGNLKDLLYPTNIFSRSNPPTNIPGACDYLGWQLTQNRANEPEAAAAALSVGRGLEAQVRECLDIVGHLQQIGVGRWHTQGHAY